MRFLLLVTALVLAFILSIAFGGVSLPLADLPGILLGQGNPGALTIIWDIRVPRSLLAVLVGAGIAGSGAVIQGLFRNPLADPALIGVSAGAALFAALFIVAGGAGALAMLGIAGSAFAGGLLTTWIVLMIGRLSAGTATMLLAGIAINAIALSGVGLLSYLSTDMQLRSISFWALGSLNGASWMSVAIACVIPVMIILMMRDAIRLNVITLGDQEAEHLGVSHRALRTRVIVYSAVCVGVGVALTGVIAFIGLIVPHLVRMTLGASHQVVLPASALLGALVLLVADFCARTLLAPVELPVGILTALIGGPFFMYLLVQERKSRYLM